MSTRSVAKAYFDAIAERDVDAMVGFWKPGGREFIRGQVDTTAPETTIDTVAVAVAWLSVTV